MVKISMSPLPVPLPTSDPGAAPAALPSPASPLVLRLPQDLRMRNGTSLGSRTGDLHDLSIRDPIVEGAALLTNEGRQQAEAHGEP